MNATTDTETIDGIRLITSFEDRLTRGGYFCDLGVHNWTRKDAHIACYDCGTIR